MKRILTILLLFLLPSAGAQAWTLAQRRTPYHAFGVWVDGGYSRFLTNMPGSQTSNGGTAGVGALYELKYRGFMFQTGVGFRYQHVRCSATDTAFTWEGVMDNDPINPKQVDVHYSFYDHRDRSDVCYIEVPLLFGTGFAARSYNGPGQGYFLAGPKVRFTILGQTSASATGTTTGTYDDYIGDWAEMDPHGFRKDVPVSGSGPRLNLGVDLAAHVELGYEYGKETSRGATHRVRSRQRGDRVRPIVRVAGFIDCGLLNIMPSNSAKGDNAQTVIVPASTMYDFSTFYVNHVFRTAAASDYWLRNLFVGVKLTVLFRMPNHDGCVICNEYQTLTYKKRNKKIQR